MERLSDYAAKFSKISIVIRSLLTFTLFVLSTLFSTAQKITVNKESASFKHGHSSAFILFIPHATLRSVEKKWIDFLKDNDAKVKSNKDGINGQNAIIKSICLDTMQIYSRITESKEGISLTAAFSKDGTFISPATFSGDSRRLEGLLHDMALPLAKDGLDDKVKTASKMLNVKLTEMEELQKRNEHLVSDIEKMRGRIADNEREIRDIKDKTSSLSNEIKNQRSGLDNIKSMASDLE